MVPRCADVTRAQSLTVHSAVAPTVDGVTPDHSNTVSPYEAADPRVPVSRRRSQECVIPRTSFAKRGYSIDLYAVR